MILEALNVPARIPETLNGVLTPVQSRQVGGPRADTMPNNYFILTCGFGPDNIKGARRGEGPSPPLPGAYLSYPYCSST